MPGFNGTGPLGYGCFTGRGNGFCLMPEEKVSFGYGKRNHCFNGRMQGGVRKSFWENQTNSIDLLEFLKNQKSFFTERLNLIDKKIAEIENEKT